MERWLEYTVPMEMEGHKISEFLHGKGFSHQNLAILKRMPQSVLVDGTWKYLNDRLQAGDCLQIHIQETENSEKIPPVELPFPIVYEDEDIVVVNKPSGMPIHPSMKNYTNTLGNAAAWYFARQGKPFIYRCVNRLDKDTTGLTILAKHMVSGAILYDSMLKREINREYIAIVENAGLPDTGTIDLPLGRKPDSAVERIVDPEHGERAVTHYRVLARTGAGRSVQNGPALPEKELALPEKGLALLSLHLETGRTHQIRVHMAFSGHPLIGDFLYNPDSTLMARQALHAGKLSFRQPITGQALEFTAPLPPDMLQFFPDCGL